MTSLALSRRLLDRLQELPAEVQSEVHEMTRIFLSDSRSASLDLESYQGALDPRFRTVRLSRGLRGLVWALEGGHFVLDDIASHDRAEMIARRRKCSIHPLTGVLRILDIEMTSARAEEYKNPVATNNLFEAFSDKHLRQVGVSAPLTRILRKLTDEEDLEALAQFAPTREMQAAFMLAAGYTVDSAFAELAVLDQQSGNADPVGFAIDRAGASGNLFLVRDERDLMDALGKPFEAWRIYLHPSQRELIQKPRFEGPVRVIGGPGTGKTVVALHRARYLAQQSGFLPQNGRILFTTYSTSLAHAVEESLYSLGGDELCKAIDVHTIDGLASQVAFNLTHLRPPIISEQEVVRIITELKEGNNFTPTQILREWEDVILARGIRSRDDYLTMNRSGSGRRLSRPLREDLWQVVDQLERRLRLEEKETFLQRAGRAGDALSSKGGLYDHAIVDEAQDFHPSHWRLLRSAVIPGPNDLFIVGDAHQRIYRHRSPLSLAGINCRGRSRRLSLNYRTSAGIVEWAKQMLCGSSVDDLDDGTTDLLGYRSVMDGPPPSMIACEDQETERLTLKRRIEAWKASAVPASAIAVACRTNAECDAIADWLSSAGISAEVIRKREHHGAPDTVNVLTMHRIKGLEFRAVAVIGASDSSIPQQRLLLEAKNDPELEAEIRSARATPTVYACTRPREALSVSWVGTASRFLAPVLQVKQVAMQTTA